jgi:hypothetical protein
MMETITMQYTPGPWIVKHAGIADEIWSDRGMIAELSLYPHGSKLTGANAELIASAPAMAERIKMLEDQLTDIEDALIEAGVWGTVDCEATTYAEAIEILAAGKTEPVD